MDAVSGFGARRVSTAVWLFVGLTAVLSLSLDVPVWAASHRTRNFLVTASTQELAVESAETAERLRRELAISWLGHELPDWQDKCPIQVTASPQLLAGGVTEFYFDNGRPYRWRMSVQGTRERVLDSVLPHEVLHTIFATHFGGPLPRWADEGACTTVEDISERSKQQRLLYRFLTNNQGIPFKQMFAMRDYPTDVLPLYSQGYALTRFLLALRGQQVFVKFVGEGMRSNDWAAAVRRNYEITDLNELQIQWLAWVRDGADESKVSNYAKPRRVAQEVDQLASAATAATNSGAASTPVAASTSAAVLVPVPRYVAELNSAPVPRAAAAPAASWYERQRNEYRSSDAMETSRRASESRAGGRVIYYR
ncbi:MAG: hypothetical protein ACKOBW_09150 [Planctomycetota bacterium]